MIKCFFKCAFIGFIGLMLISCSNQQDVKEQPDEIGNPSVDNNKEATIPIKILSLDGGGIRGIIVADILAGIEKETGKRIYELFDIVAGTSTGGLIALLATTPNAQKNGPLMTAAEIEKFYIKDSSKIFEKSTWSLGGLTGPRYDITAFEKVIKSLVQKRLFKDSFVPLLITAFDIERKQGFVFESDLAIFDNLTKEEVARATSAAPTYFEPKFLRLKIPEGGLSEHYMVDGGLYKNNPSVIAYRKAIKLFGRDEVKKRGVLLISIGTGKPIVDVHDGKNLLKAGFATWAPAAIDAIIDGSSYEDHWYLDELIRSKPLSKYVRIQADLNNLDYPDINELDNIKKDNINRLVDAANYAKNGKEYKEAVEILKKLNTVNP